MADEQTPQSDLIDDAIRNAERQLEQKLEALRMSALGNPTPPAAAPSDDTAVLRPTGGPRTSEPAPEQASSAPTSWREADGDDVTFAPVDGSAAPSNTELYVPERDIATDGMDQVATEQQQQSNSVSGLSATWSDGDDDGDEYEEAAAFRSPDIDEVDDDAPEPLHNAWTSNSTESRDARPERDAAQAPPAAPTGPAVPSEEEMQFWAHTRTALRTLQQMSDGIPGQVTSDVSTEVARIVHEEIGPSAATMRLLHQQLQQGLPKFADRIEGAIDQAMTSPNNGLRQVRDELPIQVDRAVRETRIAIREELETSVADVHGAVQQDVAQLEQSIATNVTRMAQGTGESVARVERDVDLLGESVVRFERGVHSEFDRVEAQLRSAIERVEQSVRQELVEPSATVRKLDEELPVRFGRIERAVLDQVQTTQRELSEVLVTLVDTSRASLDRLASLSSTIDNDRARRAEDVELIIDTVTTGWEGLAGAVKALFEQNEENARRIAGIEQRLSQLRDLEGSVDESMREIRAQVSKLQKHPIVVNVSHPDAEVTDTTRER